MRRFPRRSLCLLRAAPFLILAGCAVDEVVAPTEPPGSTSSSSASAPFMGEFSIPIPPDNRTNQGELPWTPTSIVIPEDGEYRVRVQGMVEVTVSPSWLNKPCSGGTIAPYAGSYGPAGRGGWFSVGVRFQTRFGSYPLGLKPVNDATKEVVVSLPRGAVIWAYRTGLPGGGQCILSSGPPVVYSFHPMFSFGGTQKLVVTNAKAEEPCPSASFNLSGYSSAYTTGASSDCEEEKKAKLVLECNGERGQQILVEVERGERLACRAELDPAGDAKLEVTGWTAVDTEGHTIPGPQGDERSWGGTMVVRTTVKVEGTVDGNAQTATAEVSIKDREWEGQIAYLSEPPADPVGTPHLQYPPTLPAPGDTAHGVFGAYMGAKPSVGPEMVTSGPNDGWWYVPRLPQFSGEHRIYINKGLYPEDPFYRAQRGGGNKCSKRQMDHAREFTINHEKSHYNADRRLYEDELPTMLESALLYDPDGSVSPKEFDKKMVQPYSERREQLHAEVDKSILVWTCSEFHDLPRNGG
jgi:hypothetical protein